MEFFSTQDNLATSLDSKIQGKGVKHRKMELIDLKQRESCSEKNPRNQSSVREIIANIAEISAERKQEILDLIDNTNVYSRWRKDEHSRDESLSQLQRSSLNQKFSSIFTDLRKLIIEVFEVKKKDQSDAFEKILSSHKNGKKLKLNKGSFADVKWALE